ncbi:MAG: hypothetical protein F6K41_30750 [Symploca sp. SIO3E6]|nr:hypothetical protein [Caldora sp. SIO3E6]
MMDKLETLTPNASPEVLEKDYKADETLFENSSQTQSNSEAPSVGFDLAAIAALIASQNEAPSLEPVSREGTLPVSFAQERLWLLHQLSPENPCYHQPIAFRLTGSLNVPILEQSLREIIRRHEALRTSFTTVDEQAVQVIHPDGDFSLSILDFTNIPNPESQIPDCLLKEIQKPFDFSTGSLLRATLVQLREKEQVLLFTMHHIACDGWSEGIFLKELSLLYQAFSNGKASPLPELPIQYPDFAHWQRQWLNNEKLESQLTYWKEQLSGEIAALQLPIDYPRPSIQTHRGECQSLVLSKTLTKAVKNLSQQEGVTLFVTLMAAFKTLLHRYTQQEDILLCSPFAGRNRAEIQDNIGYFNNVLPMRTNLSGNPSFKELLSRLKKTSSGAIENQDVPLQKLADLPNLAGKPLSRCMFALLNTPEQFLKLPGITVSSIEVDNGAADFDLFLVMKEKEEQLTGVLQYKTDLFKAESIIKMLQYFEELLENLVANPEQQLSSLPLFGDPDSLITSEPIEQQQQETVAPRNDLERQLTKIWETILNTSSIGVKDNFFELGGSSLLALRLVAEIEKVLDKKLSSAALFQAPTIEQQANILSSEGEQFSGGNSSLVKIQPNGTKPPLFIVQVLGEGLRYGLPLARRLGNEQPVYGLSVGVMDEDAWDLVKDAEEQYLKDIRSIQPKGPYFLAGPFCGGRIVYNMARKLQLQGEQVALVAMFNTIKDPQSSLKKMSTLDKLSAHWNNFLRIGTPYIAKKSQRSIQSLENKLMSSSYKFFKLMRLPLPQGLKDFAYRVEQSQDREALRKKRRQGLVGKKHRKAPEEQRIQQQMNQQFIFTPEIYTGRVTLFRPMEEMNFHNPDFGWNDLAPGGLEIYDVPGDNYTMFDEPQVKVFAEKLKACLDKAQ